MDTWALGGLRTVGCECLSQQHHTGYSIPLFADWMVRQCEWDTRHSRKDWNHFRHMLNLVFSRWRAKSGHERLTESRHTNFIYTLFTP